MRVLVLLPLAACTPEPPTVVVFPAPTALGECPSAPRELEARMWVSGQSAPCPLRVDLDANVTQGECDVAAGVVRRLTIDWYQPLGRADGLELVLAQAQGEVDLQQAEADTARFEIDPSDIRTTECLDMRKSTFDGAPTVSFNGADVPLCDLDASGADNFDEVCSGADPLDPGVEP